VREGREAVGREGVEGFGKLLTGMELDWTDRGWMGWMEGWDGCMHDWF
jgi:hypothetical protein